MRTLPRPTDANGMPFDVDWVYSTCISNVDDLQLRMRLRGARNEVRKAAKRYDANAAKSQFFHIVKRASVGKVTKDEMVKLYKYKMVPSKSPGRPIYDRIISAPANLKCPLCDLGTVSTLDHYLPKNRFPVFSITPNNLVPACTWCQTKKSDHYPKSEGQQILHPYFDNHNDVKWLAADVINVRPAAFRFYASPPHHWSDAAKERVATHLKRLKLSDLFAHNAGSRLAEIRGRLVRLHAGGGRAAVCDHLNEELDSIEADNKNSWLAAMYRAAAGSSWFCDGGFRE